MSCFTSDLTDINFGCSGVIGGIENFYIIPAEFFSASTVSNGEITAVTLSGTHKFSEYKFKPETSTFVESAPSDVKNGTTVYTQTITLKFNGIELAKRNAILEITTGQPALVCMVKDSIGNYLMFGRDDRKVYLTNNENGSGTASEDFNGYTLTFVCKSKTPYYFVDDAIVAGLL